MNPRRLYRSRDRQLAGVAGGMAEYLDIDPTVVRILWIIVGIPSGGLALIAYFVLALVLSLFGIGLILLAYMAIIRPSGTLCVMYRLR